MEKKPLDPRWVNELIDFMIGPQMVVVTMRSPKDSLELTRIIRLAIMALYEEESWRSANEWVFIASNRVYELYNTFMTARLRDMLENGVPEKKRIVSPGLGLVK